jgi:hypothetical protein
MKLRGTILFKEQQYFRIAWMWWLIGICMLSVVGINIGLLFTSRKESKSSWIVLPFVIIIEILVVYFMYITRLDTVVTGEGVFYRWAPIQRSYRFIPASEIAEMTKRDGPTMSYGCNWVPGYGRVNNVAPGMGFQFVLKNGKKIFLGTGKQIAFENAIQKIMNGPKRM